MVVVASAVTALVVFFEVTERRARARLRNLASTSGACGPTQICSEAVAEWWRGIAARRPGYARRNDEAQRAAAEELLRLLAADVIAGADPRRALSDAAALMLIAPAPGFVGVGHQAGWSLAHADVSAVHAGLAAGVEPAAVLAACSDRLLRSVGQCWQVTASCGAPLAPVLERLAAVSRAEATARHTVATAMAGPRATIRLLAILPAGGFLLASGLGGHPAAFLFGTGPGFGCLVIGVLFEVAGLVWSSRIVAAADPDRQSVTHGRSRR